MFEFLRQCIMVAVKASIGGALIAFLTGVICIGLSMTAAVVYGIVHKIKGEL